eukprot:TRINITY_DN1351_c0_g2_i1.p2 TRINITY_DN1351_c0_g2~~TRINITY_DN1351_c0_g2_i1.p2  ORF type:complete len:111 (+),score=31.51 TRINITY_DN1351_c0_g2_i1:570-902(+)
MKLGKDPFSIKSHGEKKMMSMKNQGSQPTPSTINILQAKQQRALVFEKSHIDSSTHPPLITSRPNFTQSSYRFELWLGRCSLHRSTFIEVECFLPSFLPSFITKLFVGTS